MAVSFLMSISVAARPRGDDGPQAWPSDRLQACAYALLIEEHTDTPIEEARIRYHADNVTVRVPIDAAAREDVHKAVERARELRQSVDRPPVTDNSRLCLRCSLAPVCLPEEGRLSQHEPKEPLRLFPQDRERQTVHVTTHGARIGRAGDTLTVVDTEGSKQVFPIRAVGEVVVHGNAQISTQAIHSVPRKKLACIGSLAVVATLAGLRLVLRRCNAVCVSLRRCTIQA